MHYLKHITTWEWHMSKEPNASEASSQQYLILTLQDNWPVPSSSDDKASQTPAAPWPPGCNFEWLVWHLGCWVAQASAGRDPWAPGCSCTAAEPRGSSLRSEGGLEQWGGLSLLVKIREIISMSLPKFCRIFWYFSLMPKSGMPSLVIWKQL